MPVATAEAADAVTQVHAIHAAGSFYRTMMDSEYHGVALAERHYFGAGLHPRALLGDDEFTAGEVLFRLREQNRDLQGEDMLAVEILVQAVVIPRLVLK